MKLWALLWLLSIQNTTAHCLHYYLHIQTLVAGSKFSIMAVRQPQNNSPTHDYTGTDVICNIDPSPVYETVEVVAGDNLGSSPSPPRITRALLQSISDKPIQAPVSAADWDGSGKNWFKRVLYTTIPKTTPCGEYPARIEQIGLYITGTPEFFVSCAQIKVTNGGNGNPPKISIPGYIPKDGALFMSLCPGPSVWRG
ncbi:hypothetical protein BDQ17DRAFT_1400751 [Cyathus striatus]|nr:hypothetical protein BDQ17DRAFT_1400751 [Cyathus striatus]